MGQTQMDETLQEWRESAPYWEKHARTIRKMFAPVTRALIEEACIDRGHCVLDVAGGPGEPSLSIAETVGPSGSVTCTDAIPEMVKAAESEAIRRGITNIDFRRCEAERLPFDTETFDAAVSRLGVMFFPDPLKGLREMVRVTKPAGAVSLAAWHRRDLNPFAYIVTRVMSRYVETPPVASGSLDAFRFAESGTLANLLAEARATNVQERILKFRIEAPISPKEFWAMRSETSGTLREQLMELSAEQRVRVAQEVQDAAREFFPSNRMSFPAQMFIVTGTKPA